ncbi:MAG: histidinol-phosphate transaminase [Phormidesmis sp.]
MAFLRADLAQFAAYKSPHPVDHPSAPKPLLDPLDTNESPLDLPEALKQKLASDYVDAIAANRYPDGSQSALKQAVISYAKHSSPLSNSELLDSDLSPANVTLGNGSDELIRSVIMATCLGNHGSILVASPTFSMYAILAQTLGIPVYDAGRNEHFEVNIEAAEQAIASAQKSGPPVRVVFMVHPNSPTGNALTPTELTWLKQLPTDILIVVDEAYFEFSGHTTLSAALSRPNWLVTRTFSKAFRLAAHRVGYGIGHANIIAALEKLRLPYNLPSFSQSAAQVALAHSDQLLEQIPLIVTERDQLLQALAQHPCLKVWPSDSNFIYARLSDRGLATLRANKQKTGKQKASEQAQGLASLFEQLKAKGTLIRHTGGGLRISIGTPTENQRTLANFQQVLTSTPLNRQDNAST